MAREVYVFRGGKLVPKAEAEPVNAPHVIRDDFTGGPLWHPATGQMVDGKAEFRRITAAAGCVEVGDQAQKDTRAAPASTHKDFREAAGRAINMLKSGYSPHIGREGDF